MFVAGSCIVVPGVGAGGWGLASSVESDLLLCSAVPCLIVQLLQRPHQYHVAPFIFFLCFSPCLEGTFLLKLPGSEFWLSVPSLLWPPLPHPFPWPFCLLSHFPLPFPRPGWAFLVLCHNFFFFSISDSFLGLEQSLILCPSPPQFQQDNFHSTFNALPWLSVALASQPLRPRMSA